MLDVAPGIRDPAFLLDQLEHGMDVLAARSAVGRGALPGKSALRGAAHADAPTDSTHALSAAAGPSQGPPGAASEDGVGGMYGATPDAAAAAAAGATGQIWMGPAHAAGAAEGPAAAAAPPLPPILTMPAAASTLAAAPAATAPPPLQPPQPLPQPPLTSAEQCPTLQGAPGLTGFSPWHLLLTPKPAAPEGATQVGSVPDAAQLVPLVVGHKPAPSAGPVLDIAFPPACRVAHTTTLTCQPASICKCTCATAG